MKLEIEALETICMDLNSSELVSNGHIFKNISIYDTNNSWKVLQILLERKTNVNRVYCDLV
jgi:hypothetical protein